MSGGEQRLAVGNSGWLGGAAIGWGASGWLFVGRGAAVGCLSGGERRLAEGEQQLAVCRAGAAVGC